MGKTARIRKLACPRAVKQEFHSLLLLLLLLYFFSKGFYLQRTYMLKYFKVIVQYFYRQNMKEVKV